MDDDRENSFDPRQWGIGGAGSPAPGPAAPHAAGHGEGEEDEPSFDPRRWTVATRPTTAAAAKPATATARAARAPAARAPGGSHRRLPVALACGVAIASAGVAAAWLHRLHDRPAATVAAAPVAPSPQAVRRILVVSGVNAIAPSLAAAGVAPPDALRVGAATAALGTAPGDIRLVFNMTGAPGSARLDLMEATRGDGSGLALTRRGDGFASQTFDARLTTQLRVVQGTLDARSFYSAAVAAGINDALVGDFAGAFAFDFDFQREVGPGSTVKAGFEQRVNAQGEPVGIPVLVYASLSSGAKRRALYRFTGPGDRQPGWYDAGGRSTIRALLRTPIDGARISSPFGMRDHPILGFMKLHKGTDFAAPVGTPIFAAGEATVEFAGPKGPNGNYVKLRHDNGWETLYLHMNRIWPGVVANARVHQGEQIGEVGTTGRSTGPHLHYEVHIAGEPVDPLGIDSGTGKALTGAALAAFKRERARVDALLATPG